MTTLTLPVPTALTALYLVPLRPEVGDADALARRGLTAAVPEPLLGRVLAALDAGHAFVRSWRAGDMPPPPSRLLLAMGSPPEHLAPIEAADRHALVSVLGRAGDPAHEWVARALAGVLAGAVGMPVVDVFTPRTLAAADALGSLPAGRDRPPAAGWILLPPSPGGDAFWVTTKGLGRFGLPELQTIGVPADLAGPWGRVLTGIAARLLAAWEERLAGGGDADIASVELPELLTVAAADVAAAYGEPGPPAAGSAQVRFVFDPLVLRPPFLAAETFLTVEPPAAEAGRHVDFLARVCAALGEVRHDDVA